MERDNTELLVGAALVLGFGMLLSGCAGSDVGPQPSAYTPSALGADGSARVGTLSVLDQPLVNSCDTSSFRIHQKPGEHGQLATVFEERPGPHITAWDVEYQRRNNVAGKPDDYTGALTLRARGYVPIVEVMVTHGGVYRGRMKGNRCTNWSEWIEFTVAGPEPELSCLERNAWCES